jgi:hypothetical protein
MTPPLPAKFRTKRIRAVLNLSRLPGFRTQTTDSSNFGQRAEQPWEFVKLLDATVLQDIG